MMGFQLGLSLTVFLTSIVATLLVVERGRRDAQSVTSASLSDQKLNKWLIGLSAGATANSGFVVTGAVGLGYMYGARWLLLPLAWLLGDLIFWSQFPKQINELGKLHKAKTMTDVLVADMKGQPQINLRRVIGLISIVCLGGYVSAQWLAGEKFLQGAFGFSNTLSLFSFAILIVLYTSIGGFRGSVYADTLQALVRIAGTVIAIAAIGIVASRTPDLFWRNIHHAGPDFLRLFSAKSIWLPIGLICGYAAASLGFGLGQPQIVTRYLAGSSPDETGSAWWIYISFVQFTWILMTVFGIALRGVMPDIVDPEMGLSIFHHNNTGPIITGIISADIFATIAAASNSLLVAMSQILHRDLLYAQGERDERSGQLWIFSALLGCVTMAIAFSLHSSVVSLALSSVSIMGAGLAPAMLIRIANWRHTDASLFATVLTGTAVALLWIWSGMSTYINETAPGFGAAILVNFLVVIISKHHPRRDDLNGQEGGN